MKSNRFSVLSFFLVCARRRSASALLRISAVLNGHLTSRVVPVSARPVTQGLESFRYFLELSLGLDPLVLGGVRELVRVVLEHEAPVRVLDFLVHGASFHPEDLVRAVGSHTRLSLTLTLCHRPPQYLPWKRAPPPRASCRQDDGYGCHQALIAVHSPPQRSVHNGMEICSLLVLFSFSPGDGSTSCTVEGSQRVLGCENTPGLLSAAASERRGSKEKET